MASITMKSDPGKWEPLQFPAFNCQGVRNGQVIWNSDQTKRIDHDATTLNSQWLLLPFLYAGRNVETVIDLQVSLLVVVNNGNN
ncbi:hypothetical protein V6N13_139199 [Hibiscus sabdariffa]